METTQPTQTAPAQPVKVPTKRERRAASLLEHYNRCEALARKLGHPNPNGKRISTSLLRLERQAHDAATAQCNGESYHAQPYREDVQWEIFKDGIARDVGAILGGVIPPGFFVNGDARGYALKIDNENAEGKNLIEELRLHTDWGGYGILSPQIDGN